MMRGGGRLTAWVLALSLLAGACNLNIDPLSDPGIGESALTTIVYAADGSILAHWHAGEDRTLVSYEDLPQHLIDAVVAIEDRRFWDHNGVDARAILRAAQANEDAGTIVQGGSTITQQYLKNVLLTPEVSYERKLEEAVLALRLEEGLTKEDILENYLNTIYLGDGAYGIGTAAAHYFGKNVEDLTLADAAMLAGLVQAPATINPRTDPYAAIARRQVVLDQMVDIGYITETDAAVATLEPIKVAPPTQRLARARYPYFVEELKQQLLADERLGETPTDRYNALFRGGLRIHTTLEPAMQEAAEESIATVIDDDGPDSALVSIDPRNGYVRAIVGGRDFYAQDDPIANFNLATQGLRQPGSSFKPFVLAAALEAGVDLYDVYEAGRTVDIQTDSRVWSVENYNKSAFPPLSVLEATVYSVNVVYARLIDDVGPAAVQELAERAGITSDLQPFHALALGAQEVSPFDMASAFGVFAADGLRVEPVMFTTIETHDGSVVVDQEPSIEQVVEPAVARQVTVALTEVVKRGTAQQARIGRPIAGKTGTSQDHRDAWFVGYTPDLVTSVWVGFAESNLAMEDPVTPYTITGGTWPAQIWSLYSASALAATPYSQLPVVGDDDGTVSVDVDLSTGYLAGPLCPHEHVHRLNLPRDQAPTVICPIHNPAGLIGIGAGEVPPVVGIELGEAVGALNRAGYEIQLDWTDGGNLPQGTIFGQSPDPGIPAQSGATVVLTLAGPQPGSEVPDVLGMTVEAALIEFDIFGIRVKVLTEAESDPSDAVGRAGRVWKQSPGAGSLASGSVIVWVNPVV